jgi:hypothetical protein
MPEQEQAQSQPQTKTQKAIDKEVLKIAKLQSQRLKQKIQESEEEQKYQVTIPHECLSCKRGTGFEWAELLLCVGSICILYAMYKLIKDGQ